VIDALDLLVDEVEGELDEGLRSGRNPAVALRVTSQRKPNVRMPMITVVTRVSQFTDQNPPASPTGFVRKVR
jgi:hypothetical protein